ncbi:transcriptional regulator [Vibrio sp. 10N.286.55.E10]|uniref:winged helix-turn-helix domain-containing protein n=1 Tax=unclassified Vibrio TaxID=2614977 RepID=UPI000C85B682|nr:MULTISPECIES: winged helix-turn-helix domain-containing protein [unclassified Vibrio]PME36306.1 transcriptional regulator [Vibrio sp. 10N.286.55.E10]PME36465.1 transcriptional regulator [Vibrio sp. 10N.286.55.E12]PME62211.1 transcriptional regulator [Vibrio sp. 10N.286.55.C11]PTP14940.1 transcriptional regulator [Vibrio sp. 10N.286.51.C3]PTQ03019.1 transcriptional regulator [Vibrio sp. ZF 223]
MTRSHCFVLQHDFPIAFYPDKNQLVIDDEAIHLEPLQAKLLSYFIENRGQVVSTQQIASDVWQRTQVSDNLVRQVISLLRSQLQDKSRPYRIIQTIPKQGYQFDVEVTQSSVKPTPVEDASQLEPIVAKSKKKTIALITTAVFSIGLIAAWAWQTDVPANDTAVISAHQSDVIPVYIHDITLDSANDYEMSESVYNYLFYGLNSAKNLSGYHFSQLSHQGKQSLTNNGVELKGWLKQKDSDYVLSVLVQNNRQPNQSQKVEKRFSQDNFFDAIGDVILEVKAIIAPMSSEYGVASHRVTSIDNYDDWSVISEGISLFYQGKGGQPIEEIALQLDTIQQQGRDNYLVNALLSYSESLAYLQNHEQEDREHALQLAKQAFEMNPRCDIANLTLGLALLINQHANQAFPYLSYAAESTPSPISFYLLSVADKLSDNPKGSQYNYQRYTEVKKENDGQLFDLIESL